ncbi:MAG: hypothetical protein HY898_24785 [Deltaproteobacteria bacterium]|nr:hypothetical protein [Deltaproteobacteria bacterium]
MGKNSKKAQGTEAAPDLPPSAIVVDHDLVERAVEHIRNILGKTVARGMDEVGSYLLKEFYGNDPALYSSSNPSKHASLRQLEERCETLDLPVKKTFLSNAIRMAVVLHALPAETRFLQLPSSHRVELLKVKTPDKIEQLATRAVESKLSVQKLREIVRKEREKTKSTRGRKPTPPVLRALGASVRMLRDETTGRLAFRRDDIDALTDEQMDEARAQADMLAKRVEELLKLLG